MAKKPIDVPAVRTRSPRGLEKIRFIVMIMAITAIVRYL